VEKLAGGHAACAATAAHSTAQMQLSSSLPFSAELQAAVEQARAQVGAVTKEKGQCASSAAKTEATLSEKKAAAQEAAAEALKEPPQTTAPPLQVPKAELPPPPVKIPADDIKALFP